MAWVSGFEIVVFGRLGSQIGVEGVKNEMEVLFDGCSSEFDFETWDSSLASWMMLWRELVE